MFLSVGFTRHWKRPLTSSLDFQEIPLNQIIDVISEEHGITIVFDRQGLESLAISEETEITIKLSNLPLKSVLNLMLAQVEDLTYLVNNDVLMITTRDVADSYLETRIYDVNRIGLNSDTITKVLEATVEHDSWSVNGTGEGMCEPISNGLISISQTQAVHERIAAFLAELQEQVEGRE